MARNITPREKDYSAWYHDVIQAAQLADYSPVRGCMVMRPLGYALWENIQRVLDRRFKDLGHQNAYFPLFIPESFLRKEQEHVEGFAPECAVVTHGGGEKLEEPLVVRPTSETIIGYMYSQWVKSWRDLPVLINQWANVVRWELRTRLFLRTAEFLWQEGHTAHETEDEAQEETLRILDLYKQLAQEVLGIPVFHGEKTESERFPGAVRTYCIEGMMQDGKALQMGTSHNLGQNFSKAFEIRFEGRDQKLQYAWTTSWGVSTRLIGAIVMAHSDDDGLVMPPRIAPTAVAIVPIFRTDEERTEVLQYVEKVVRRVVGDDEAQKGEKRFGMDRIARYSLDRVLDRYVVVDHRDTSRPGEKFFHWEQRGVPLRFEVGPRDARNGVVTVKTRVGSRKEQVPLETLGSTWVEDTLNALHHEVYQRALKFRDENTTAVSSYDELKRFFLERKGFVRCFFKPSREAEAAIKAETKATVRLILPESEKTAEKGRCIYCGEMTDTEVLFAIAY